jgi:hypothetical protein
MSQQGVYRFFWDCGRAGDISGIFLSTRDDVANLVGKEIYFGEVLGKHSEVAGTIGETDIKLVTEEPIAVAAFMEHNFASGYNPFDYYEGDYESDEEE